MQLLSAHRILSGLLATVVLATTAPACARGNCLGDINGDNTVDAADLAALLIEWGNGAAKSSADLNADGTVNAADLSAMLVAWGPCVNTPPWATLLEALPDPAVVADSGHRAAITATGLPWRVRDTATGVEMVLIPPGTFNMGCSIYNGGNCSSNQNPRHAVTITNAFYIGRYEIKQSEWTARMGSNPSNFQSSIDAANHPVEMVSWDGIQGFLASTGFRLPSEAEWEYAYRAGTDTSYHAAPGYPAGFEGPEPLDLIAWFVDNAGENGGPTWGTKRVGLKAANGFGVHDMSGNVWEWVNDWYGASYYSSSPATNPPGPASGDRRVVRGGSWVTPSQLLTASIRDNAYPDLTNINLGFRVVRNP
jgi:formylglycine-generating enzyme required for sulfatase activity